jgi:hypothetical protein
MTKQKKSTAKAPPLDTKEALVSSEKPVATSADPSSEVHARDEQNRRVVIFASILLVLLAVPVFLPVEGNRSLWGMTRYDSTGKVLIGAIFGWPVCLGVLGISRGLRKNVPGKILIGIATGFAAVQTLAGLALVAMLLAYERHAIKSPLVWFGAACTVAAVGIVVRSFFRTGWLRWQHIMAPIGLLAAMIVLCIAGLAPNAIERASDGGWGFLFATAALVPFIGRTIVSRRD